MDQVQFLVGVIQVSPLQSAQTGSGFYSAAYLWGNADNFPELKQSKHEADHLTIPSPFTYTLMGMVFNLRTDEIALHLPLKI